MMGTQFKAVLAQATLLVAIGTAIGVADGFVFRPVSLVRPAPPPVTPTTPAPKGPVESGTKPPDPTPLSTPTTQQAAPVPQPGSCSPTPKDKLPQGHITMDEAKSLFDGGTAVFIDTRRAELYEQGHVRGAYRIELHAFDSGDPPVLQMIPRQSQVVCYGIGGNCDESEAVARMLSLAGYASVYVMHDGFPCWKSLGFPADTGPGAFP